MKKSQMQMQIMIYIMVLVVSARVLVYGYQAIKKFRTQADDVLTLQFKNKIKNDFTSLSFDSTKINTYDMPSSTEQVCFKANGAGDTDVVAQEKTGRTYPLIRDAINGGTEDNIFLYPKGTDHFYSGTQIKFNDDTKFKCFDIVSGRFTIKITGQGSFVLIEPSD